MPSKSKAKDTDDAPVQPMTELYEVTIAKGQTESDEIDIAVSEISVRSDDQRVGPAGYQVRESAIGKCRIVLAQPASDAATFHVSHANVAPNAEDAAATDDVHRTRR